MKKILVLASVALGMMSCQKDDSITPTPTRDSLDWTFSMSVPSMDLNITGLHPTERYLLITNMNPIGRAFVFRSGTTAVNVLYCWSNGSVRIDGAINGKGFISDNVTVNVCHGGQNMPMTFALYDVNGNLRAR